MRSMMAILAICCFSLAGCGTFSDAMCGPITDHTYYRGVRFDIMAAQEGGPHTFMAGDIPLSVVVDTVLFPFLAYREMTSTPRRAVESSIEQPGNLDQPKPSPLPHPAPSP